MKKENRKMAQMRRAEERRKKALRKKISKILAVLIPLAVIAAIVALLAWNPGANDATNSSSGQDSSQSDSTDVSDDNGDESDSDTDSDTYSTDSSLTVEDGDTVNIDYVGTVDGVEFSGGNTNGAGTDLVIGSGSYIDDFEDQLIGAHPGDTVDVTVTFPDPYQNNTELSGKEAVFSVTVNGIYK